MVLPFLLFLILNRCSLFLLTVDTPFPFHHSYKKFENRSFGGACKSQPFGLLLKGFLISINIFIEKEGFLEYIIEIYCID
jgi:hypothetical protein